MTKNLILFSQDDTASINILNNLLKLSKFDVIDTFAKMDVYENDQYYLVTIEKDKVFANNIDITIKTTLNLNFDCIIVASKHKSSKNIKTLSVHPVGNFNTAEVGGVEKTLVPTSPELMSQALRLLKKHQISGYDVTLETTHHGPFLDTKTFFIEVGSTAQEWADPRAGSAIAKTLIELSPTSQSHAIGFGGGHYVPQITDLVLSAKINIGHMASKYVIEYLNDALITQMIVKSDNPEYAYIVKRGLNARQREKVQVLLEKTDINIKVL